jgi:hypothetical protein
MSLLPSVETDWRRRREFHENRVRPWVEAALRRKSMAEKHPVYDFLFDYYSFRPSHLLRWSPGMGIVLPAEAEELLEWKFFSRRLEGGIWLDPADFPAARLEFVRWVVRLLRATGERPPQFGCFGLHEWAMIYRSPDVRHRQAPLRMAPEALAEFVESQALCCTHYDAFRFFTSEARPLNRQQLRREAQPDFDQRGCLHVNMDLYKWAYKLAPWIPAEITADAFALAWEARELDMRASPYDLTAWGFPAVPLETAAGRQEYERGQRRIAEQAEPVRRLLLEACERILAGAGGCSS